MSKNNKYEKKSVYEKVGEEVKTASMRYAEGYMRFLDAAKTEREAVNTSVAMLEAAGYRPYTFGMSVKAGDKLYYNNRGKSLYAFRMGTAPLTDGIRILGAHIDSPRIDLKQNPVFEDTDMCFFKTHYYGGIRKYQWLAVPLALHGVVVKENGEIVNVTVGEREDDPVFCITDLLPHLAGGDASKTISQVFNGEKLNILIGSRPAEGEDSDAVKSAILDCLYDTYGITEEDLQSAELSAVPAGRARDLGFDRSMIGAYGHDDRVCAYPSLTALLESDDAKNTVMVVLSDKEETGSDGVTGMQCDLILDLIRELSITCGVSDAAVRAASVCLSADVSAAFDPAYADVFEKRNAALLGYGVAMCKYTGSRGKSGTSDATAELVARVRRIFNGAGVVWQTCELGKVDIGGGGTIAKYMANHNIDTIDVGVSVLSMHAPFEVISKADLYETHRGFLAFCLD